MNSHVKAKYTVEVCRWSVTDSREWESIPCASLKTAKRLCRSIALERSVPNRCSASVDNGKNEQLFFVQAVNGVLKYCPHNLDYHSEERV